MILISATVSYLVKGVREYSKQEKIGKMTRTVDVMTH